MILFHEAVISVNDIQTIKIERISIQMNLFRKFIIVSSVDLFFMPHANTE